MPLEKTITAAIVKAARSRGWWVLKIAGGAMQRPGLPDLLCIRNGVTVFLEVKTQTGKVSQLQQSVMTEIERDAKCKCEVVRSIDEAIAALGC